ncbi:phosphomethylpyrimidine kinase [Ehrlichia chaffeensis str. Heartland]|uniref:hydroxymethylpyrimidine kinase n=1 Tax=Ehrlichia chaffeensis (strain ATCC CRL-10679 / Arkansas) TaxID=205920 RepID=Q2GFS8_EHRCR|nr:bifunctional hydroxymethylpyrimidine kinase/phosphomethylpyrimidine kinase [Ehrlichia chaffeensis]ABD44812.1 phosphomethylpyrimidine kinase [Ehrlichia chaffeensis str. Arkansas]AHX03951.1 phosphomethylpyrimidine kinase [Ehrlichia chaffeensis str. Heartland]AHX05318.1 phosphomethylpyrimidine kinase [Ehrlichia chaffeensis str. Jax]AHX06304.1 phosphomethylpyrimidine kinase [Ehrlichia chaffeensis str. Liberty]AHX07732.1 phosphomethylpyrimidine kinase [Ehrlichia chaffeensis str. Osceola]
MTKHQYKGRVLTIAGSDSGGGAGIQADIKTISALGCYAASCITSVTAQNTTQVYSVYNMPQHIIQQQIEVVLSDINIDTIKIGMLPSSKAIKAVAQSLPDIPIIVDPVMVSASNFRLMDSSAISDFIEYIIPKTTIITPNIPEAEALAQIEIKDQNDMTKASKIIKSLGTKHVLIKGGHINQEIINNILLTEENQIINFSHKRISKKELHGTGCTLSSAIASFIAQKMSIQESVNLAIQYILNTIKIVPQIGKGNNPVFHNYNTISSDL